MINPKNSECIFFIFTPLQALIASSIIIRENLKNITIIALHDTGRKTLDYCRRITSESAVIVEIPLHRDSRALLSITKIFSIKKRTKNKRIRFFTGSIKSFYSQLFISNHKNIEINTFDDGYGNIVIDGYLSEEDKKPKRFALRALGVQDNYKTTIKKIKTHYTIYDLPNIYEKYCKSKKLIKIQPFSSENSQNKEFAKDKTIKILLTQPYSERNLISAENELILYNLAIEKFSIDLYLPHPAEARAKISLEKAKPIETELIAEELIIKLSNNSLVEVYAFGSTALLNLVNTRNIKCVWMTSGTIGTPVPGIEGITKIDISGCQ